MIKLGDLIDEHLRTMENVRLQCLPEIEQFATLCKKALQNGHTIYLAGNGGSACDCQHFAAELVGRFQKERQAMAAVALTTDTSILTALANDYGFDVVFMRQVQALVKPGDIVVGISTSGNSKNIIKALEAGKIKGASIVGLTGQDGGQMKELCDVCICIPSTVTARIQEAHLLVEHMICQMIEE